MLRKVLLPLILASAAFSNILLVESSVRPVLQEVVSKDLTTNNPHSSKNVNSLSLLKHDSGHNGKTVSAIAAASARKASSTEEMARALYVRHILHSRLLYVESGRRSQDFGRWLKSRNGDATIFSMHGVQHLEGSTNHDGVENADYTHAEPLGHAHEPDSLHKSDPFAMDRMNMDLVVTPHSPHSCFQETNKNQHVVKLLDGDVLPPPSTFRLVSRAVKLSIIFAPVWSTVLVAAVSRTFRENVWYKWIANAMGASGAAWIKWGQWSSTRTDMFPEAFCDSLSTLHNAAPAHSSEYSKICVEKSLGIAGTDESLLTVFDEFDEKPLASGSVAQVHRAVLCGTPVAVKIRHPRVAEMIDLDFRLMNAVARAAEKCFPKATKWLHISESVSQFSHTMAAQAMLFVEAHHLEILNYNFRRWPTVKFPEPFYASSSVIIESFEPGQIVSGILDLYDRIAMENQAFFESNNMVFEEIIERGGGNEETVVVKCTKNRLRASDILPCELAKNIVTKGLGIYLKMLLVDNLMHADLHPGNILIKIEKRKDECASNEFVLADLSPNEIEELPPMSLSPKDKVKICFVDAGMVAQLTEDESTTFIGLLASLGEGNGELAAKFALQFSLENNLNDEEQRAFAKDMVELFAERCHGYGSNVDCGHVLRGVLGLVRKHHVRIDANFATLVVNCLCIESLAREVCPEYNVLDASKPLLQTYRKLCYTVDGTPKPRARRSKLTKLLLSATYAKKWLGDNAFFNRHAQRRSKHGGSR